MVRMNCMLLVFFVLTAFGITSIGETKIFFGLEAIAIAILIHAMVQMEFKK